MKLSFALLALGLTVPAAGAPVSQAPVSRAAVSQAPVAQAAVARVVAPAAVDSEATLEYLIGLAGKLSSQDTKARLDQLKAQLEALLSQKKALISQLVNAQHQASGAQVAGDQVKVQALVARIQGLEASLAKIDVEVEQILGEIRKLYDDEERRRDGAKKGAEALQKFTLALGENPPRDAFVKTLSPAARDAALGRARRGHDALAAVAQVALLAAANANQAALDAAETQRRLVGEQKKLRSAQTQLDTLKAATPTPTPSTHVKRVIAIPR